MENQKTEYKNLPDWLRIEALPTGIIPYYWDIQTGAFTMADFSGILGPAPGEVSFARPSLEALLHPDDRGKTLELFQRRLSNKNPAIEIEYRILTTKGDYTWVMDRSSVVEWTRRGEPLRIAGVLIDISRRKAIEGRFENQNVETEAALQRSEAEKHAILKALQGLVTIRYLDPGLRILWDNTDMSQESNPRDRATPGDHCYRVIWGRTEPCSSGCTPLEALKDGEIKRKEARLEDGRAFIEASNPVKDATGAVHGVVFVALNITEHKQIEENYKTTHEFLHSFLENLPTPISVLGLDGRIELVNPAWEKLVGLNWDHAVGRSFKDIFPTEVADQINRSNMKILRSNKPLELEESIDFPSGSHYFHTVKFPLQDGAGHTVIGTISVDQTARKRAERELTQQEGELRRKSLQLEETNTALKVLLRQREKDQRELERRIVTNIKQLVLPYAHKLKKMHLNGSQANCLEILETHLHDILTPFMGYITSQYPHLTAKEIQIATLVRDGQTNKDIAELMNLSVNTVQTHRHNLRKKLGLKNNKTNLRSYLLSLNMLPT